MNEKKHTSPAAGWTLPPADQDIREGAGRSAADIAEYRDLIARVEAVATRNGWSKSEVATRVGVADSTFSQLVSGKYEGRLDTNNKKLRDWLTAVADMEGIAARIPSSPPFLQTKVAREINDALLAAQTMPAMVMVSAAAGMGKTTTARRYVAGTTHSYLATISPHTRTVYTMLVEVADALDVHELSAARLVRAIGTRLSNNGVPTLLIVDEAQNLVDEAINQLRHFTDNYGCGIALLGNDEIYRRFGKTWSEGLRYGQLRRRIFKRVRHEQPLKADLEAFIGAYGISEADQVAFLVGVGMKPGAFGQIDMTVKLASMTAMGRNEQLTLKHLKAAWTNRNVEGA